jgi:hypothetical protein
MTGIFALNRGGLGTEAANGGRQALATSMSFQEALQAAEQSTNRMFGFDELGIFGCEAATQAPERVAFRRAGEKPAGGRAVEASGVTDRTAPHSAAQTGDNLQEMESTQIAEADIPAAACLQTPGTPIGLGYQPAEGAGSAETPVAGDAEQLVADAGGAAPDGGLVDRQSLPTSATTSARLAVMIEGGSALLVVRDFSLGEEDRDRLEKRAAAILAASNLSLSGLTLNGIAAEIGPVTGKEA